LPAQGQTQPGNRKRLLAAAAAGRFCPAGAGYDGVSFLDSAGVGALVQLFVHRRGKSQSFALAALTQQGNAVIRFPVW